MPMTECKCFDPIDPINAVREIEVLEKCAAAGGSGWRRQRAAHDMLTIGLPSRAAVAVFQTCRCSVT
jgi:hypothetical protein